MHNRHFIPVRSKLSPFIPEWKRANESVQKISGITKYCLIQTVYLIIPFKLKEIFLQWDIII